MCPWGGGTGEFRHYVMDFVLLPPFFLDDWTQGQAERPRYGAYWNAKQPLPPVVRKGSLNKA